MVVKKSTGSMLLKIFRQSMVLVYIGMAALLVFTDVFVSIPPVWRYGAGLLIFIYAIFRVSREFFDR